MSIKKRTVYYVQPKGKQVRFAGFAVTTTTLGTCFEPFEINDKHTASRDWLNYDPSDPLTRVDRLQQVASEDALFYDANVDGTNRKQLHGGSGLGGPRVVIKTGNFND